MLTAVMWFSAFRLVATRTGKGLALVFRNRLVSLCWLRGGQRHTQSVQDLLGRWLAVPFGRAVVLGCAMLLAGCAGASESVAVASTTEDVTVQDVQRALFGFGDVATDVELKAVQDENAAFEERVAQCMVVAGFEYYSPPIDVTAFAADDVDYNSREYAETHGFGYTTTLGEESVMNEQEYQDPNAAYLGSLSPSERDQFYVVLYGDQSGVENIESDDDVATAEDGQPALLQPTGCYAEAASNDSRASQAFYEAHSDEINEMYELAESSPQVQAALTDWSLCMAEQGHDFATPDDFDTVMDPYMSDLYSTSTHPANELSEDKLAALSDEERNELWSQPEQYDQALLAEAQRYEIEIAVASWDCGQGDLYDSYQMAIEELQQKYVETNLAELTKLLDQ